jgi:DNA-binding transcriptional MerR regulator
LSKIARDYVASHRSRDEANYFGITELAAETGTTARAIRFYEDKGLLKPRRINGGRAYTRRDCVRLSLIQRGKAMGMSLAEVKHILDLYGERGQGKIAQLEYILGRIDESISELEARRDHIATTLAELKIIRNEMLADMKRKRRKSAA